MKMFRFVSSFLFLAAFLFLGCSVTQENPSSPFYAGKSSNADEPQLAFIPAPPGKAVYGFSSWRGWGAGHYAQAYGDFNGDGKTDLIFKHANGNMWVNLSTGSGFAGWGDWGAGHYAGGFGDFNGDGKTDLIFKHANGNMWVNLSTGSGFSGWGDWGAGHYAEAYRDFNGDGKADLIFKHANGNMWVNLSTGSGFAGWSDWGAGHYAQAYGDFNGDGKTDLIFKHANGHLWVNLSTGAGFSGWGDWGADLSAQFGPWTLWSSLDYEMDCADFNGDGKDDLVFKHPNGQTWINLSKGNSFAGWSDWGAGHYADAFADFTGDGKADLIFKHSDGSMWICPTEEKPQMIFTSVPPKGVSDFVYGLVYGADPSVFKIALYIYVPGWGWVVKPTYDGRNSIYMNSDGAWRSTFISGGNDINATIIAAFLVSKTYNIPGVNGSSTIPADLLNNAKAQIYVYR